MTKKKITEKLEKQGFASESGEGLNEDRAQDIADTKLLQDSNSALQTLDEDSEDLDLMSLGYSQVHHEAAEDADDELDSEDDNCFEEIRPLVVKKTKTDNDQVHLSTNHPEQNTQTTGHTRGVVKWVNNIAQPKRDSAEIGVAAHIASKYNLPRALTPYPKLSSVNRLSDLLNSLPPLRRRKGSEDLREGLSDSALKIMSSNTYLTSNQRGKMPEGGSNEHAFSGGEQGNTTEIMQNNAMLIGSDNQAQKPNLKARTLLGYVKDDESNAEKSTTYLVTPPKAAHKKKPLSKIFRRKGSKKPATPSSSEKPSGRKVISAPILVDASPNAKALLSSASSLIDVSPSAKHVVNYSRPIVRHSSNDGSSGSPIMRQPSENELHGSNPFVGPGTVSRGLANDINASLVSPTHDGQLPGTNEVQILDHSNSSTVQGSRAADTHHALSGTLSTANNADGSDSDSFNPSDYSGDEDSVQQAVPVPIVFSGRAKLVDIRPPHGTKATAPRNQFTIGNARTSRTTQLTDHDAEVLGAQDAARYYNNGMRSQSRPRDHYTEDPFIDPPFRPLLAKPANEIAAREMARLKASREGGNPAGGDTTTARGRLEGC